MNRSMRSDLRKSVRTVLSSREGRMDEWIPRRAEPDSRESDEQEGYSGGGLEGI